MKASSLVNELTAALSAQINNNEFLTQSKDEIQASVKILLESALRKMDVVSREEFDAQCAVLQRTREKLNELEKKLEELA